jgi:hypothetical protein
VSNPVISSPPCAFDCRVAIEYHILILLVFPLRLCTLAILERDGCEIGKTSRT